MKMHEMLFLELAFFPSSSFVFSSILGVCTVYSVYWIIMMMLLLLLLLPGFPGLKVCFRRVLGWYDGLGVGWWFNDLFFSCHYFFIEIWNDLDFDFWSGSLGLLQILVCSCSMACSLFSSNCNWVYATYTTYTILSSQQLLSGFWLDSQPLIWFHKFTDFFNLKAMYMTADSQITSFSCRSSVIVTLNNIFTDKICVY